MTSSWPRAPAGSASLTTWTRISQSSATNPRTSFEAEFNHTLSGKRLTHCELVLSSLLERPGRTAEEYGERTGLGRVEAARRLSDLKGAGLARMVRDAEGKKVIVRYGGTSQSVWEAVGAIKQLALL